jgi:anti-sigma-K factor RskA
MNYQRPELIDRLAGEYVLGTLLGRARRRFERLMNAYLPPRRAVIWWEQRLADLALTLPGVEPPPGTWSLIERRIAPITSPRRTARGWQALAACLAAVTIGLVTFVTLREPPIELRAVQPAQVAIVADAAAPLWVVHAFPELEQLRIRAVRPIEIEAGRAYELWMLPNAGTPPVSLGLLPASGEITLPLSATAAQVLIASSTLAVSLEPAGGSPTGAPTGPVVYTAALVQARG